VSQTDTSLFKKKLTGQKKKSISVINKTSPVFFSFFAPQQLLRTTSRKLSQKMTSEASSAVSFSYGERWCVVTGGRGFAARHLVEQLIRSGAWSVRIVDLAPTITLDPYEEDGLLGEAIRTVRAVYASADLRNKDQIIKGDICV
jgi:3-beta hydroxysteroid dehydrogenase/isomerase family